MFPKYSFVVSFIATVFPSNVVGIRLRKISFALLTIIIICVSLAANPSLNANGQSVSQVGASISADTTWLKSNSPYDLTADLYVNVGVTLTIEPGVVINYNSHNFRVNGVLKAQGTETEKICFNAGPKWDAKGPEVTTFLSGASIVSYSILSGRVTIRGNVEFSNNFIDGEIGIQNGNPVIAHNYINGSMFADGIGVYQAEGSYVGGGINAIISDNELANCYRAIAITAADQATITRNYFHNNQLAIISGWSPYSDLSGADSTIINNTIKNNQGGIIVTGKFAPIITGNNIEDNTEYSLSLACSKNDENITRCWGTSNQSAPNNWWGTTNPELINQSITDHYDNTPSGIVTFTPFLTEPNI